MLRSPLLLKIQIRGFYKSKDYIFKPQMYLKQSKIMTRLDDEVNRVMAKILKKEKVKGIKRAEMLRTNKAFLEVSNNECAATLLSPDMNTIAAGSPEQLAIRKDGMPKAFLSTRMKVFNTNFSRAVTEACLMDDDLSKNIELYKINITQVRVSQDFKILNIYWATSRTDIELKEISDWLKANGGKLHAAMIDTQYTNSVPWISFIRDLQHNYEKEIQKRLDMCKNDLISDDLKKLMNSNTDLKDNDKNDENAIEEQENDKIFSEKSMNFENQIQEVDLDEYYYKTLNVKDSYTHLKYVSPDDMEQSYANLDYDLLINKVLQNLKRTRQKIDLNSMFSPSFSASDPANFKANQVGIHLPPIDVTKQIFVNTDIDYNTDERIKAIRKFVQINKHRKDKEANRLKLRILQEECKKFDSYEDLKERVEGRFGEHFKDYEAQEEL